MNLLVPPLVAAVTLSAYVATLSSDRTQGDDRRVAAESLLRHHDAAVLLSVRKYPDRLNDSDNPSVAPFIDVVDWDSVLAEDTQGRLWVMTYIDDSVESKVTSISDLGIAGIPFELQRLDFGSGTHGYWKGGVFASAIGAISFDEAKAPPAPDGAIMVATLCEAPGPSILQCGRAK